MNQVDRKSTTTVLLQQEQLQLRDPHLQNYLILKEQNRSLKGSIVTENRDTLVIHDIECN